MDHHTVTVTVPDRSKFDFGWAAAKPRVIDQIRSHLKPQMIRLVEEFATPAAKEKAKDSETPKDDESPAKPAPAEPSEAHAGHTHAKAAKPKEP